MLHIITGLPGSGKSEASRYLAKKLDAVIINTDELRDLLFPQENRTDIGDFTPRQLKWVYRVLLPIAHYVVQVHPKKHIIMEGTFRLESQRNLIITEMNTLQQRCEILLVEVNDTEVKKRIQARFDAGKSKATVAEYLEIKKIYEKPNGAYVIENSGMIKDLQRKLDTYITGLK